jgi:hypothetical protein
VRSDDQRNGTGLEIELHAVVLEMNSHWQACMTYMYPYTTTPSGTPSSTDRCRYDLSRLVGRCVRGGSRRRDSLDRIGHDGSHRGEKLLISPTRYSRPKRLTRTSLIFAESVKNMTRRSIPRPHPPVGGRPYSRLARQLISCIQYTKTPAHALINVSSTPWASSSPASFCLVCSSNLSLWSNGSLSSV